MLKDIFIKTVEQRILSLFVANQGITLWEKPINESGF